MRKPKQYDRIHVENFDSEEGVYMEAKKLGFGLMRLPLTDANDGVLIWKRRKRWWIPL